MVGYVTANALCTQHHCRGDSIENRRGIATCLEQHLISLDWERRLIMSPEAAEEYFRGAALRQEAVFLSYTAEDQVIASVLRNALKKRFQRVFDYRESRG